VGRSSPLHEGAISSTLNLVQRWRIYGTTRQAPLYSDVEVDNDAPTEPIDEFTAQNPYFDKLLFRPFQESLDFATTQPPTAGFNVVLEELTIAQQSALTGKSAPKEALDEAAANVNEAMES
jgi:ABC-type glycerol-3-phosphate transport system substrate-binding protein